MENVGTWNSDYAILFFGALVAPFFLYFLGRFCNEFLFVEPVKAKQEKPKKSEKELPTFSIRFEEAVKRHKPHCPHHDPNLPKPQYSQIKQSISRDGGKTWEESMWESTCRQKKTPTWEQVNTRNLKKSIEEFAKSEAQLSEEAKRLRAMKSDAVGALSSLGFRKSDAKKLIEDLCKKKEYNSLDSLIDDCFMCIKNV